MISPDAEVAIDGAFASHRAERILRASRLRRSVASSDPTGVGEAIAGKTYLCAGRIRLALQRLRAGDPSICTIADACQPTRMQSQKWCALLCDCLPTPYIYRLRGIVSSVRTFIGLSGGGGGSPTHQDLG